MYFVVTPFLVLIRNGSSPDSPPQSSGMQLHVEPFDKREDAMYYQKSAEKYNPPGAVLCFEGKLTPMQC